MQTTVYCYIVNEEDIEKVFLVRNIDLKLNKSYWSFISTEIEYRAGDKWDFYEKFGFSIREKIGLSIASISTIDISSKSCPWVYISCNNKNGFPINLEESVECDMFEHNYIKNLPINENLQEFLSLYPDEKTIQIRCEQVINQKSN